jgi:hypothetical protein
MLLKFSLGLCTKIFYVEKESSVITHREEWQVEKQHTQLLHKLLSCIQLSRALYGAL